MTNSSHEAKITPVEEMDIIPTDEELINLQGIQGESIFYLPMSACVSHDTVAGLQRKIDETLENVQGLNDDRLLVLIGALVVENAVDELLASIMPGYKSLQNKRDFTLSMRIEIARAMKLIPPKILNSADFVRKLRNSFVHDLSVDSFEKLESSELQSIQDRLHAFNPEVIEDNARAFSRLVLWLTVALHTYTMHTSHLNDFIRDNRFLVNLQSFVNQDKPMEKSMRISMSDSQKAKIYNHLQNAGVRNLCPACNQDVEWQQANIVTVLGMTDSILDISQGIPLIPVICKNCGYVRFFSAKSIGLF